jgi:hypothetical protein
LFVRALYQSDLKASGRAKATDLDKFYPPLVLDLTESGQGPSGQIYQQVRRNWSKMVLKVPVLVGNGNRA